MLLHLVVSSPKVDLDGYTLLQVDQDEPILLSMGATLGQ